MPRRLLTAKNVETLPAIGGRRTDYRDTNLPGLVLRVSPAGARGWSLEYFDASRKRGGRHKLGNYPQVSLAKARDLAREAQARVRIGEPLAPADSLTVAELVRRCLDSLTLRPATLKEWERLLRVEIAEQIGKGPAERLTRAEVKAWNRNIAERTGYVARHALALLKRAYSWGLGEELVTGSPCLAMPSTFRPESSERVLSTIEVGALVRALDGLAGGYRDATLLLLLTGVRRAAVLGMKRRELQGLDGADPLWSVPGGAHGRSKSLRPHVAPLSAPAVAAVGRRLEAVATEHLFPRAWQESGVDVPATWPSRWVNTLKAATLAQLRLALEDSTAEMPPWKIHSLRHTLATHMREDLKVGREVVSAILGHAPGGASVTRVYDRSELLAERRAALVAWAAWLEKVARLDEQKGADVLAFVR